MCVSAAIKRGQISVDIHLAWYNQKRCEAIGWSFDLLHVYFDPRKWYDMIVPTRLHASEGWKHQGAKTRYDSTTSSFFLTEV